MKIRYNKTADELHIQLSDKEITRQEEVHPGITFAFAEDGTIAGIDLTEASRHVQYPSSIQVHSS